MKEWLEQFLKAKDAFRKEIQEMKWEHNMLTVTKKDKEEHYITCDVLGLDILKSAESFTNSTIVAKHSEASVDELVQNWPLYAKSHCKLIFVKRNGSKVILNPRIHASVADPESLELGLRSLFGEE